MCVCVFVFCLFISFPFLFLLSPFLFFFLLVPRFYSLTLQCRYAYSFFSLNIPGVCMMFPNSFHPHPFFHFVFVLFNTSPSADKLIGQLAPTAIRGFKSVDRRIMPPAIRPNVRLQRGRIMANEILKRLMT